MGGEITSHPLHADKTRQLSFPSPPSYPAILLKSLHFQGLKWVEGHEMILNIVVITTL